jgi:hypothetical protein
MIVGFVRSIRTHFENQTFVAFCRDDPGTTSFGHQYRKDMPLSSNSIWRCRPSRARFILFRSDGLVAPSTNSSVTTFSFRRPSLSASFGPYSQTREYSSATSWYAGTANFFGPAGAFCFTPAMNRFTFRESPNSTAPSVAMFTVAEMADRACAITDTLAPWSWRCFKYFIMVEGQIFRLSME